jgi:hypothetical protein
MRKTLAALAVVLALTACGTPAAEEPSAAPVAQASSTPSLEPTGGEPSPTGDAPSIDDIITEEAKVAAGEYLAVIPMSRDRLIDQMNQADGIPVDIAAVAVDSLGIDWNEQAARTAATYEDEALTRAELVQQLTSSYEQYTPVQAEYAADQGGY